MPAGRALLLAATSIALVAGRAPQIASFSLVRGGSDLADYHSFVSSRNCLHAALPEAADVDDIVFHEGNVPKEIQASLKRTLPNLIFVDVRTLGAFALPEAIDASALANSRWGVGYRHMCHFNALAWFGAMSKYEYALRVDEDVCIERMAPSFMPLLESGKLVYGYGVEMVEGHTETLDTFKPFLHEYMAKASPALVAKTSPVLAQSVFFTNFFVSRVDWWTRPEVAALFSAIDASSNIYLHRWGDAPIQTAALHLFADPSSVQRIDMDYVHMSTHNRFRGGQEVAFTAKGIRNDYFRHEVQRFIYDDLKVRVEANVAALGPAGTLDAVMPLGSHPVAIDDWASSPSMEALTTKLQAAASERASAPEQHRQLNLQDGIRDQVNNSGITDQPDRVAADCENTPEVCFVTCAQYRYCSTDSLRDADCSAMPSFCPAECDAWAHCVPNRKPSSDLSLALPDMTGHWVGSVTPDSCTEFVLAQVLARYGAPANPTVVALLTGIMCGSGNVSGTPVESYVWHDCLNMLITPNANGLIHHMHMDGVHVTDDYLSAPGIQPVMRWTSSIEAPLPHEAADGASAVAVLRALATSSEVMGGTVDDFPNGIARRYINSKGQMNMYQSPHKGLGGNVVFDRIQDTPDVFPPGTCNRGYVPQTCASEPMESWDAFTWPCCTEIGEEAILGWLKQPRPAEYNGTTHPYMLPCPAPDPSWTLTKLLGMATEQAGLFNQMKSDMASVKTQLAELTTKSKALGVQMSCALDPSHSTSNKECSCQYQYDPASGVASGVRSHCHTTI